MALIADLSRWAAWRARLRGQQIVWCLRRSTHGIPFARLRVASRLSGRSRFRFGRRSRHNDAVQPYGAANRAKRFRFERELISLSPFCRRMRVVGAAADLRVGQIHLVRSPVGF